MEEGIFNLIGQHELRFGFKFDSEDSGLGWGEGVLWVYAEPIWFQKAPEGERMPVHWTWIDLLEFLGRNWVWLAYEESYPFDLTPLDPTRLRAEARKRWDNLPESDVLDEDEQLFRFERRHNLASGMKGIFLPEVSILREGKIAWLCAEGRAYRLPLEQVLDTLESVGEFIATRVLESAEPRARRAVNIWQARDQANNDRLLQLRSGLTAEEIGELQQGWTAENYWELQAADDDSELLAAARLSAGALALGLDGQKLLLTKIRSFPHVDTPVLDAITKDAQPILEEVAEYKPFEQGYRLANWLRIKLGCERCFEPETVLKDWSILIDQVEIPFSTLDAVACWGKRHGPAIILNEGQGTTACTRHGRRSTLAHEIGHLLMDRYQSLPLAEVLGGATPAWVEQRARAFAAELLLPRNQVLRYLRADATSDDIDNIITSLVDEFDVSRTLAIYQIWNSEIRARLPWKTSNYLAQLRWSCL